MFVIEHSDKEVNSLAFSASGSQLGVSHRRQWVGIWDVATRQLLGGVTKNSFYTNSEFRFHPTLPRIYFQGWHDTVKFYDPVEKLTDTFCEGTGWTQNAILTRDAKQLLVCEHGYSEFRLFDLTRGKAGKRVWNVPVYSRGSWGVRVSMELFADDSRFIVAENHGNSRTRIAIRSLEDGKLLDSAKLPNRECSKLALSPDGTSAVVMSATSLFIYNTGKLKRKPSQILNDNRKHFTGIAFHPSGKYLAATSNDATVKLFDTTTWEVSRTFTWDIGKMRGIAFSPDGMLAAAGSDSGKVVVWDVDV